MYFVVDTHIGDDIDVTGSDALVYFALSYLTKHGAWKGSSYKLAKYSLCGSADTASRALDRLVERGLFVRISDGSIVPQNAAVTPQNAAKVPQNAANPKESSKENINKNKSSLSVSKDTDRADGRTDFDIWWSLYAPTGAFRKKKNACRAFFDGKDMCDDWRKLAIERAQIHDPDRDPYWWLHDYDFLDKVGGDKKEDAAEKPDWLNRDEQTNCLMAHIPLATCWNPDTKSFGVVTLDQAERLGLPVKSKLT